MAQVKSIKTVLKDPSLGWPTYEDIKNNSVCIKKSQIDSVEEKLEKHKKCLIISGEGRGKTVLARIIGFIKDEEGWKVRHYDVREIRKEKIDVVIQEISRSRNAKTLYIIENAHASLEIITPKLSEIANKHSSAYFLFTSRKISAKENSLLLSNPFEQFEKDDCTINLTPNPEYAKEIILTYLKSKGISYSFTNQDKLWIESEFGKDTLNLRRIKWYLDALIESGGQLSQIPKQKIYEKVKSFFFKEVKPPEQKEMIIQISSIFQFDLNFDGKEYDKQLLIDLVKTGLVASSGENLYRLQHSSDAAYLIEAVAVLELNKEPDDYNLKQLKKYLIRKPDNYFELLRALYINKKNNIIYEIFNDLDSYDSILSMLEQDKLSRIGSILNFVNRTCDKEKAKELWTQFKRIGGETTKAQTIRMKKLFASASLLEISNLLKELKRIDKDEIDWIIKNRILNSNNILAKVDEESFSTLIKMLVLIPHGKAKWIFSRIESNLILEFAKKRSGMSLMWLLINSNKIHQNKTKEIISYLDKDNLIDIINQSHFSAMKSFTSLLPVNFLIYIFSNLDLEIIFAKIKECNPMTLYWFLHYCIGKNDQQIFNFAQKLISGLEKRDDLRAILYKMNHLDRTSLLRTIKKLDQDIYLKLESEFPIMVLNDWLNCSFGQITYKLKDYIYSHGEKRGAAQSFIKLLAKADLTDKINQLFNNPQAEPFSILGKFFNRIDKISRHDVDSIKIICNQIVNDISFDETKIENLNTLSFFLRNLKFCDESAWRKLCEKIINNVDLISKISIPLDKHLPNLIWNFYQFNKKKARKYINKIFSLDFKRIFKKSDISTLSNLIWNFSQFDKFKLNLWMKDVSKNKMLDKALTGTFFDTFMFLWSLFNLNEEYAKILAINYMKEASSKLETNEGNIYLLGFLEFCGITINQDLSKQSCYDIICDLFESFNSYTCLFQIYFLKKIKYAFMSDFLDQLSMQIYLRNFEFNIDKIVEEHPFIETISFLKEILDQSELRTEPKSTLDKMFVLTQSFLMNSKKGLINFNKLKELFLISPAHNSLFKSENDAQVWIEIAIDFGMYNKETVTSYKDSSRMVSLISLNDSWANKDLNYEV